MIAVICFIALFVLAICFIPFIASGKIYCYVFEHKDWKLWEMVLKNFEGSEYLGHYYYDNDPKVENHKFKVTLDDGSECCLIYWVINNVCSAHDMEGNECLLSNFDRYHSQMAVAMVKKRLNL